MGQQRYFSLLHPVVLLLFCAMAVGVSMALFHPVYTGLSLVCAALCNGFLRGWCQMGRSLRGAAVLAAAVAVVNPLINQRGVRIWFYLGDHMVTVESALFGLCSGCALAAALLWFGTASVLITQDKFLFLFSRFLPGVSLMLSMTMKLVPVTRYKIRCIQAARKGLEGSPREGVWKKVDEGVRTCSVLLEWSMEDSIETADSMRARGFGTGPRTFAHHFVWRSTDRIIGGGLLFLSVACIGGMLRYGGSFQFFPKLVVGDLWTPGGWAAYWACALLLTAPLWVEGIFRAGSSLAALRRKRAMKREAMEHGSF